MPIHFGRTLNTTPPPPTQSDCAPMTDDQLDVARQTLHKILEIFTAKVGKRGPAGGTSLPRVSTVGRRVYALMFAAFPELLDGRSLRDITHEIGVSHVALVQVMNELRASGYRCERMRPDSQRKSRG